MENHQSALDLLELLSCPGFCVKDGAIIRANQAASQLLLGCGTALAPLLHTGSQEYEAFTGGCLYLTLQLQEKIYPASVTAVEDWHLFLLEAPQELPELQAYALAAQALRQPLTTLMTLPGSELLRAEDPKLQKQASLVSRSLFQLLRLVGNMADAHRYRTAAPVLQMQNITAVLEEIFSRLVILCRGTGVSIRFTNLRQNIYCLVDAEKLERGIYNIISNSMKSLPQGGQIQAALTRSGSQLLLRIQDNGSGIPGNQRSGVYRSYLRQPGLDRAEQGVGLGMQFICAAATAHGGTVLLENPPEGGTKLTMTLPIRQSASAAVHSPRLQVDYAGEWDHALTELSDCLPDALYRDI